MTKILFDITPQIAKLRDDVFVHEQGVSMQDEHADNEKDFVHICKFEKDKFEGEKLVAYCRVKIIECQSNTSHQIVDIKNSNTSIDNCNSNHIDNNASNDYSLKKHLHASCCITSSYIKIGRVAVDKNYRNKSYGKFVMQQAHEYAINNNCKKAKLSSQIHAVDFYKKLGYNVSSKEYIDAGIVHVDMVKEL